MWVLIKFEYLDVLGFLIMLGYPDAYRFLIKLGYPDAYDPCKEIREKCQKLSFFTDFLGTLKWG